MNLYDKIRNAECEIPEAFDLTIPQADNLIHNADAQDRYDLVWTAFKFGYMQGKRAEQISRTNKANGNRAESEAERLRRHISEMVSRIRSEKRLQRIYAVAHRAFINDGLEALNERQT